MRKNLLSMMMASGVALTSCAPVRQGPAPLEKKPYWEEGHTMVNPELVRTVKHDAVTQDMNGYRRAPHNSKTMYYFDVKDSTVVAGRLIGSRQAVISALPVPYENMDNDTKGYFAEASEYARNFMKMNGPK